MDVRVAVESFLWISYSSGDTVLKCPSFGSVWAMFKTSWLSVWNFTCTDIWWYYISRPWLFCLCQGSKVNVRVAVESFLWVSYSSCNTVLKSLSFRSVWAMFKTCWLSIRNFTGTNVWWYNVGWPWFFYLV